jgi:hypothetical protein
MSFATSSLHRAKIDDYKYLVIVINTDPDNSVMAREIKNQLEGFGHDLYEIGAVSLPFNASLDVVAEQVKSKQWPEDISKRLRDRPYMLVINQDFNEFDPRTDSYAFFWFSNLNGQVGKVAEVFHEMAKEAWSGGDLFKFVRELNQKGQKKMNRTISVLFLAANPKDTPALRLDEEIRGIDLALRQSDFRDRFDIKQQWAVHVTDLQGYFLRHKPDIVHFSGHGSASSQIILEDNSGNSHPVSPRALSQVFSILKDNIRCVVLNACYSEQQAQAIAQHIDCVIGMSKAVGDDAAISFAAAFYQGLGYGRNVKTAFDLGCAQIDLENLDEQDTPKLLASNPANIIFVDDNE